MDAISYSDKTLLLTYKTKVYQLFKKPIKAVPCEGSIMVDSNIPHQSKSEIRKALLKAYSSFYKYVGTIQVLYSKIQT